MCSSDLTKLRIGFAQSVARPEMEAMRAGIDASVSATDHLWSGSGGNPKLRPWRSYDADISLEHYFGIRSYVALAGFYKDFQSAIVTKDVVFDFAGYTNPSGVVPVSDLGTLDTPTNVRGGWVRGVELSGTLDLASFADWLDGFGIMGNWAHSASSLPGTDAEIGRAHV